MNEVSKSIILRALTEQAAALREECRRLRVELGLPDPTPPKHSGCMD